MQKTGTAPSSRGPSAPGSPATSIVARMDNQVIGYKDLAAIPKDKAILEVERPDLMVYEPHFNISALHRTGLSRSRERSMSPHSISPPRSPEIFASKEPKEWPEQWSPGGSNMGSTVQLCNISPASKGPLHHFHRPDSGTNIYKKPPIYKHERHTGTSNNKQDNIIESSKFPAAQPPDPNQPSKIETEYWPCPPSRATMGKCTPTFIGPSSHLSVSYNVPCPNQAHLFHVYLCCLHKQQHKVQAKRLIYVVWCHSEIFLSKIPLHSYILKTPMKSKLELCGFYSVSISLRLYANFLLINHRMNGLFNPDGPKVLTTTSPAQGLM
ncbi:dematin-like isoform X1 [Myxocyprinus asiaticus]|uniref:dematin-like isoform X1 n=1 Tax=Myxocyprinus asiaticus TaxID=70543 RepID=UPI002221BA9C|nr:dematin-like isoform X1 [Myxocyprinus asiaticus]XP_051539118.1 dematin-like isoform X1 [Myxocyprinus asiaticus]